MLEERGRMITAITFGTYIVAPPNLAGAEAGAKAGRADVQPVTTGASPAGMLSGDVGRWQALTLTREASLVSALSASVLVLALAAPSSAFARLSWTGPGRTGHRRQRSGPDRGRLSIDHRVRRGRRQRRRGDVQPERAGPERSGHVDSFQPLSSPACRPPAVSPSMSPAGR